MNGGCLKHEAMLWLIVPTLELELGCAYDLASHHSAGFESLDGGFLWLWRLEPDFLLIPSKTGRVDLGSWASGRSSDIHV
jgi:hypothetical protein